jgi:peptide/nickel transport system ATP-binding protein
MTVPSAQEVPDTATPVLAIENLGVSYFTRDGEIPAVVDVSLHLQQGECLGLVGESGCGKTTVALAIMRYLGPNGRMVSGRITFKGRDLGTLSQKQLRQVRGAHIAMVYQEPLAALNPSLSIGTQLSEVSRYHQHTTKLEAIDAVRQILHEVRLSDVEQVMAAYAHQLSGGQLQRVVIAMALLAQPELLLLDEPTTALDVTIAAGIVELIGALRRKFGTSMLFISHNLGLIAEVCDRLGVMYAGQIVEAGTVRQVFKAMRHPYTRGLLSAMPLLSADKHTRPLRAIPGQPPLHWRPRGCTFAPRCDHYRSRLCDTEPLPLLESATAPATHLVRCVRWQEITRETATADATPRTAREAGPEVLRVEALRKYYALRNQSLKALLRGQTVRYARANESISFRAHAQETVAIVGESGCGKSTIARVLMGLETASAGRMLFHGEDLARLPVHKRTLAQHRALQMVFQHPHDTLNPSLTIGAQIARGLKQGGLTNSVIHERVMQLLDRVQLPRTVANLRPHQLSGGQKQRVGIARAFAGHPSLVVADEPVSGLDVSVQAAVIGLLLDLQQADHTTLIFISHDLSLVRYLADRVVVLYLGQVMEQGRTHEVFAPPYHPYTQALLSAVPMADPAVVKSPLVLEGPVPSSVHPPQGCPFVTRCPRRLGTVCEQEPPPVQHVAAEHVIACHIPLHTLRQSAPVFRQTSTE